MGLYDVILIKDNHIDYTKGISYSIEKAINYTKKVKNMPIIIEVRNLDELTQVLQFKKISRIILDNFKKDEIKKAVKLVSKKIPLEVSGNINETNIRDYAKTGVDYISIGALTHSVKNIDMSLKAELI